jgi:hypothetical protein
MKLKTQDLTGSALDWAVAKCEGRENDGTWDENFSSNWLLGGPIIEREDIAMWPDQEGGWFASTDQGKGMDYHGGTALIAAMRCFVASKLGDTVDIPEELL